MTVPRVFLLVAAAIVAHTATDLTPEETAALAPVVTAIEQYVTLLDPGQETR